MPLYDGVEVVKLNDSELMAADRLLSERLEKLKATQATEKFKKKMNGQPPPTINPAFTELHNAIKNEINKREL